MPLRRYLHPAGSVDDRPVDEAFIKLLRERKVVYVTTLIVNEGYQGVLGQTVKLTDIEQRMGDPETIATWSDLAWLPVWKRPVSTWSFSRDLQ